MTRKMVTPIGNGTLCLVALGTAIDRCGVLRTSRSPPLGSRGRNRELAYPLCAMGEVESELYPREAAPLLRQGVAGTTLVTAARFNSQGA
jgi:hypothetical protein